MTKCYVCSKKTEKINHTSFKRGDNVYIHKSGFLSSVEVILCENCNYGLEQLDDNSSEYYIDIHHGLQDEGMEYIDNNKTKIKNYIATEKKGKEKLENDIVTLLKNKAIKMTISDITAHIKHDNRNYVKSLLEEMHKDEDIDFAGSGRYFIYSEKKKSSKKASTKKADPTAEIRKYAKLRDDGLITEEEYQAKKKEILGL